MIAIKGYEHELGLYRSHVHTVWRGRRIRDGRPVVVKTPASPYPAPDIVAALRREYDILKRLDGRGAPRPIAMESTTHGTALVMEDSGAQALAHLIWRGPLPVSRFLDVALSVLSAVEAVHRAGLIHKNLSPHNILLDPDGTARCIDFDAAATLASAPEDPADTDLSESALAYMAPEQTGRVHRGIDHRTDFYALGATFYELLTGRHPFPDEDPLDLIHAHLGRPPEPPETHNPRIPATLSRIILKLLAKAAEDRYQSLRGLRADLETCRTALHGQGTIPDIDIATRDRSEVFRLPQRLYGRAAEVETLRACFDRTADGGTEVVVVAGPSGIGKTTLVRDLFRPLASRNGIFVAGKFAEFRRNAPYAALAGAFSEYLRETLGGTDENLRALRTRLNAAVGANLPVLAALMPELEIVTGTHATPPPPPPTDADARISGAFHAFIRAIVHPGHRLIVFIDDLQWADRSSLHLLQDLIPAAGPNRVLFIAGLRDTELDTAHPVQFLFSRLRRAGCPVTTITLGPLGVDSVTDMLHDALGRATAEVQGLAQVCVEKTDGNPLFLKRFLLSLQAAGLIFFDAKVGSWCWQPEKIAALDITDNVVDLMVAAVKRLSPSGQRVLRRAACIGPAFDLGTLSRINDVDAGETLRQLWDALDARLVVPTAGTAPRLPSTPDSPPIAAPAEVRFRFLHDRVHQAVYQMIPAGERDLHHLDIGRRLLSQATPRQLFDHLFDILDQLNRGIAHTTDPELHQRVAALNLEAARRAKASSSPTSALNYARAGLACLPDDAWHSHPAVTLDLHAEAAEAAFMLGDRDTMDHHVNAVLNNRAAPVDRARVLELRVRAHIAADESEQAVRLALDTAAALGQKLPRRGNPLSNTLTLTRLDLLMHRIENGALSKGRGPTLREQAAFRLLASVSAAVYSSRSDLMPALALRLIHLAALHGGRDRRAYMHGLYQVAAAMAGRHAVAYRAAQATEDALDDMSSDALKAKCALYTFLFGLHWRTPLRDLLPRLQAAAATARALGCMETAGYLSITHLLHGLLAGTELAVLREDAEAAQRTFEDTDNTFNSPYASAIRQAIHTLMEGTENCARLNGPFHNELVVNHRLIESRNYSMLAQINAIKLMLAVVFQDHAEARIAAAMVMEHYEVIAGTPTGPAAQFYHALAYSRDPASGSLRKRLRVVRRALRAFRLWAAFGPANTLHRRQALEAEEARLGGSTLHAAELYDQAIKTAHEQGYLHEEALLNEFTAEFHESRGRPLIAAAYRRQAHHRYGLWGAAAKTAALEAAWPHLAAPDAATGPVARMAPGPTGETFDLAAIMKAAQTISGEIQRPALIENLLRITMSTAGAQRGLLILRGPHGWTVEAEGESTAGSFTLRRTHLGVDGATAGQDEGGEANTDGPLFSRHIFKYVERTGEAVVLHNAPEEGAFASDPYVIEHRPRSVLCLPLYQQAETRGMLYLENNLTAGAFTADRLEVLRLLAAQVVISLDNATLYENLATLNRDLERQVSERTREATETSRLLSAALDNMSDGLVAYDADGQLVVWNERAAQIFRIPAHLRRRGTTQDDIIDAAIDAGVLSPRLTRLVRRRRRQGHGAFPRKGFAELEMADGRILQVRRSPMPEGGEVQVFLDVTEERAREREVMAARHAAEKALRDLQDTQKSLIQAEKMASLGQLVAGVAHEINTPVGITLTASSFLSERTREIHRAFHDSGLKRSQLEQFLDQSVETTDLMMTNIQRAADLIHSFKQVAVDQTSGERRQFRLDAYVNEVIRSFGPMLRKTAHRIDVECPEDLDMDSFPGALSQVLTNLVTNSLLHAYGPDDAGVLSITARPLSGDRIELVYTDDGRGIPDDIQAKIFDPFFTTRRGSGGSGLGLNIVYNLVTNVLDGTLSLSSAPGRGTTFTLHLPRHTPARANGAGDPVPPITE